MDCHRLGLRNEQLSAFSIWLLFLKVDVFVCQAQTWKPRAPVVPAPDWPSWVRRLWRHHARTWPTRGWATPSACGEWRAIGTVEVTSSRSVFFNTRCHRNTGKDRVWVPHMNFLPISWFILWKGWRCPLWDLNPGYSYCGGFEFKFRPEIGYPEHFVFSPVTLSIGGRQHATISSFQSRTQNFSFGVDVTLQFMFYFKNYAIKIVS